MTCDPTAREVVLKVVPTGEEPLTLAVPIGAPPSSKVIVPVRGPPVPVRSAVRVTIVPNTGEPEGPLTFTEVVALLTV